jgi:hypothetical protein
MRVPEASRCLRGVHPQTGQVTRSHMGPGDGRGAWDGLLGLEGVGAASGHGGTDAR